MGCEKRIETTTREIRVYTCDVCGGKTDGRDQCPLCTRYLCHLHVAQWVQPGPDDYGTPYCESCWEAGAEARQALEECRQCRADIRRLVEVRDEALAEVERLKAQEREAREQVALLVAAMQRTRWGDAPPEAPQ